MAAPSGIVWGSTVTGDKSTRKGRIGLYTNVTSTDTQTTVELQVWFWTMYSCADGASITLKLDIGTDITAATTTVLTKKAINHTVATGAGWSTSNQTMLYSVTETYSRGTSAKTYNIYAKFSGIEILPSKTMSANTSFAVPKLASYTVSYDANGGSSAPSSQTKWHGTNLTLSSSKPTRTGYAFSKWLSTAQNQYYNPGNLYGHNESTTMKAQWTANTYTVSYDANGGTGVPANQTKTYGVALTLSSTKPTRPNYNFLGWATSASATTATYAAGASYTDNSAVTLYAVWELAYTKPRITGYSVTRCNASGTKSDSGTYALVKFSWATDNSVSSIKVEWSSSADSGSATISASGTSGNVSQVVGNGGISADATYTVKLTVADGADTNHTSTAAATLSGTAFAIDFLAGGKGAAFGKPAEKANALEIDWLVYFNKHIASDVHFDAKTYDKFGAAFHNGLAAYTGGGDSGIDPNTTPEELILTSHSNAPQGSGTFFFVYTAFYNTKSTTASRAQLAFPYNKAGSIYHRHYKSGAWSTWSQYLNATDALDKYWPVNSIYISYSHTSPASLIGGTWTRLESRFLWGTTKSGTIGATGGAQNVTLTIDQIPSHTHGVNTRAVYSTSGSGNGLTIQKYGSQTESQAIYETGGGQSHTNMPPYVNVAIWRRTA